MAQVALVGLNGVSFTFLNLNLFEIQSSIFRRNVVPDPDHLTELHLSLKRSRNHHRLYNLNRNARGSVERFAAQHLNNRETRHLSNMILRQIGVFKRFEFMGLFNYRKFLNKGADECYCDPFTPEPRVYNGHIIFSPENLSQTVTLERARSLPEEERVEIFGERDLNNLRLDPYLEVQTEITDQSSFTYGKLRFDILENNSIRATMVKRMTRGILESSKDFPMSPQGVERFKTVINKLISTQSIVVNPDVKVGRIWHSYSLAEFFNKVNDLSLRIFHQDNRRSKIVVAGLNDSEASLERDDRINYYV